MFRATASINSSVGLLLVAVTFLLLHCVCRVPDQIANQGLISNPTFKIERLAYTSNRICLSWRRTNTHAANSGFWLFSKCRRSAWETLPKIRFNHTPSFSNQRIC